jgi:hypothetical protein
MVRETEVRLAKAENIGVTLQFLDISEQVLFPQRWRTSPVFGKVIPVALRRESDHKGREIAEFQEGEGRLRL